MLVFHVDANSAYLSWTAVALLEEGYKKDIRDIPAAIAGDPENRHGIILTKSGPAKKYGIQTGETLMEAKKKCPQLEVYPPDYDLYLLCSEAMYSILYEYTPVIQRYSVDECFCDMTSIRAAREDPEGLAFEIKERIKKELGFTVNIGIGKNKVCAKMAGELKKPDMIHTLWPEEIKDKLWPLPVRELFMVGRASERKLHEMGIKTVGQLAQADVNLLKVTLKSHALLIHDYANGIDDSEVILNDDIMQKGIGNGLTYSYDLLTIEDIHKELLALCERVSSRLRKLGRFAGKVTVHLRNSSLAGYSHQMKLYGMINTTNDIFDAAKELVGQMWKGEPVRAMSISLSDLSDRESIQLSLFDSGSREKDEALDKAVDDIRRLFGTRSIYRGVFANSDTDPVQGGVNDGNYIMMGGYRQ